MSADVPPDLTLGERDEAACAALMRDMPGLGGARAALRAACAGAPGGAEDSGAERRHGARVPPVAPVAVKHDGGKARYSLIPPEALAALADAMTRGAGKYGDHNWARGLAWCRMWDAALRHLLAWRGGEQADADDGHLHLAGALASIAMLLASEARGVGHDDRGLLADRPRGAP